MCLVQNRTRQCITPTRSQIYVSTRYAQNIWGANDLKVIPDINMLSLAHPSIIFSLYWYLWNFCRSVCKKWHSVTVLEVVSSVIDWQNIMTRNWSVVNKVNVISEKNWCMKTTSVYDNSSELTWKSGCNRTSLLAEEFDCCVANDKK